MANRYGKADKVKDLFEGRFDKTDAKIDQILDMTKEGLDLAKERAGREERAEREEIWAKDPATTRLQLQLRRNYETDGDTDDDEGDCDYCPVHCPKDLVLDEDKCTSEDDCGCFCCASYKSDYDSGDAEDDKDKTVNRVNRVRYDDTDDDTDDGDDVESSDSELNNEDLAGWGFTTDKDD